MTKVLLIFLVGVLVAGLVRLILLRQQIVRYNTYWVARASEPAPANALWYVALGDSAAQGIGASKPQNGYVGLLAKRLEEKTGRPVHVINLSVTGAKLQDVVDRQLPMLQQMELPHDAVITLAIGSNNIRSYNGTDFRTTMDKILSDVPPRTIVGDIPYFGGGRANSGEKSAAEASAIIAELAGKHGLRLAPLHQVTKEGSSIRNFAADFFHPNNRGYQQWFHAFWQVIGPEGGR